MTETGRVRRKIEQEGDRGGRGFSRRFSSGLSAGFGPVRASVRALGTSMVAGFAAIGGAAALVAGGKALRDISRRMGELDAKAKAVFEGQLPSIRRWGEENKRAFGLSRRETVGLAANMADLLKPMGFTARQAADMSTKLLDLSGALSRWSGGTKSAAEVSDILSAAFLGEREALQQLGISISQAEVDAVLTAKGQEKLTGAARQQAEALATQQLIMAKSTDAQKAWANGGRDAAMAQNSLSTTIAETKEKLAAALTPAIQAVTAWLNDKLPKAIAATTAKLREAKTWWDRNKDAVMTLVTNLSSFFGPAADDSAKSVDRLSGKVKTLTDQLNKIAIAFLRAQQGMLYAEMGFTIVERAVEMVGIGLGHLINAIDRLSGGSGHAADRIIGDFRAMRDQANAKLADIRTSLARTQQSIDKLHGKDIPITITYQWVGKPPSAAKQNAQRMAGGGVLTEPVAGVGMRSGRQYLLGEAGPEAVVPLGRGGGVTSGAAAAPVVLEIRSGGSRLDDLLVEILRGAIRARGGNVQLALGAG